ncbi:MAG: hypothetical protein ABIB61_01225 [Candidatus Shapirobacteria bacterium]
MGRIEARDSVDSLAGFNNINHSIAVRTRSFCDDCWPWGLDEIDGNGISVLNETLSGLIVQGSSVDDVDKTAADIYRDCFIKEIRERQNGDDLRAQAVQVLGQLADDGPLMGRLFSSWEILKEDVQALAAPLIIAVWLIKDPDLCKTEEGREMHKKVRAILKPFAEAARKSCEKKTDRDGGWELLARFA